MTVTGTVDAHEIPLGETLSYTVTVQGAGMSGVAPATPSGLVNLQVVGGPSSSTQFSFVNGVVSSTRAYKWFLAPQSAGKARIPVQEVKVGDKTYRTEAIEIEVTPAGSGRKGSAQSDRPPDAAAGRDPGSADLRIENELSAPKVYVGQPVILTTRLLSRIAIVDVSAAPDPTVPGFLLEESDTNVVPERVFREGREYQSYVLMRRILTPTAPGTTVIPSETRTIRVRASGRDPFDSFFAPRVTELTRSTAPVTIEALAPPAAGRPAGFSGAVGQFRMETVSDRSEAAVGDAVGVKCTITGTGNLKTVESPALAPSADFRVFDPRVEEKASGTKPRTYTKTWSYVVTPLSTGALALPAMTFSYFDPEAGAYRSLSSAPAQLAVKSASPGGGSEAGPAVAAGRHEVQSLQRDIRFLKTLDGPLERASSPLYARWWFWAVLAAALAAQPGAWFLRRQGGLAALRPGGAGRAAPTRSRVPCARVGPRGGPCRSAGRRLEGRDRVRRRPLQHRCGRDDLRGDRAGACPAGGPPGTLAELRALLELCDLGRFAPGAQRERAGEELLSRARALIERLDAALGRAA